MDTSHRHGAPLQAYGRELRLRRAWWRATGLGVGSVLFLNRDIYLQEFLEPLLEALEADGREAPLGGWRFHRPSEVWDWCLRLSVGRTLVLRRPLALGHLLFFAWNGLHRREQRVWLRRYLLLVGWRCLGFWVTRHWRIPQGLEFYLDVLDSDIRRREFQPRLASYRTWVRERWISRRVVTRLPLVWWVLLHRRAPHLWRHPSRRKRVRRASLRVSLGVRRWLPLSEDYGLLLVRRLPLHLLLEGRRRVVCRREALQEDTTAVAPSQP